MIYIFVGLIGISALLLVQFKGNPIQFNDPIDSAAARHQLHFPGNNVELLQSAECILGSGHLQSDIDLHRYFPDLNCKVGPFILTMADNDVLLTQPPRSDGQCIILDKSQNANYLLPAGTPRRLHSGDRITIQFTDGNECTFYYYIR